MKIDGPVWAMGAMSGTSLDGVDVASVSTDGISIFEFGDHAYRAYSDAEKSILRAALGKWPGEEGVEAAAEVVETAHAEVMSGIDAKLAGFHGQTLAHDPAGRGTHQAGDGALLAEVLQRPVVWDFRSANVELGGQGAPLAPFFHHACARYVEADGPLVFLNLGGVGNLTWVDPTIVDPAASGACLAFDTGPANAPIDDLVQSRGRGDIDRDGALGLAGEVDGEVLGAFLGNRYFYRMPPKSLDRNDFSKLVRMVSGLADHDAAATLAACSAAAVLRGLSFCPTPPSRILVTGGGRRNAAIMKHLSDGAPCPVVEVETVGLNGDMLEAQAFAYLAVRVARGLPTSCPSTTGVRAAVGGGTVSHPGDLTVPK